ncbi:DUF3043 domain-containing protein [Pseudactinotalea sp. HY158]|uniref:DUF3043 domain-containing protein n=1 Tax=Pseudactinotalea sp. HY158 TaxID=2654547 RepID=UPI00129C6798|nr:DUF3043 domain-containing protein [Pseudactinotalea sp. HY158]QGH69483.1 DUF3043 domain-containing protein [Pseudactinotalea sp. HY158]
MFGRKKSAEAAPVEETPLLGGKGRPTPSRKEAEARNRSPLISADPKADKRAAREAARIERMKVNEALVTGDEQHLPAAHRGPVRRYIRDSVDARFMLGEWFFPLTLVIVLVLLVAQSVLSPEAGVLILIALYVVVLATLAHAVWVSFAIKKELIKKFGSARGTHMYAVGRAMQMRRMRLPKPQVKRGEFPH